MKNISIHWFRRDLRLFDNTAFLKSLNSNQAVLPLFVFDTSILNLLSKDDARVQFIFDQIESMKKELEEHRSSLYVYYGTPKEAFMALQKEYSILEVFTNRDYEPYAQSRDLEMNNWFSSQNISFTGAKDHVIFEKSEIVKDNGEPYSVFTPYSKKWKAKLTSDHLIEHKSQNYFHNLLQCAPIEMPSLASMGFTGSSLEFPKNKLDRGLIEAYAEKRDIPSVRGTSRLSLHLRFGTVSIRQLIRDGKNWSDTWLNELIWREFYQMILYHYPNSATEEFRPKYARIPWRTDMDDFELWCIGKTGYPLVDAGMRELNSTGFMHNRVRMVVASFLTKHLLLDWRLGERYFAEKLLDFELASNVGGWQWAAGCGCDAAPYFRVFNPELQMKKFDPDLKYVKTWVPEYGTPSYPDPIVEHKFARERAISTYKKALNP